MGIDGKTVMAKHAGACIKSSAVSLKMKPQESDDADSTIPSVSSDYSSSSAWGFRNFLNSFFISQFPA